ncbi:MAG: DUF1517 domain-containing protein [Myxococcota bacterium]|nr:DUF1517 domain-containing protein [Myxococcota bacterium]
MKTTRGRQLVRWLGWISASLLVLLIPAFVLAQGTGGSFGGGDWSSGGSSGGGGGGGGGDDGEGLFWIVYIAIRIMLVTIGPIPTLIIVSIGAVIWFVVRKKRGGQAGTQKLPFGRPPAAGSPLWNQVDITAVRIAIDWRARPFVQGRFKELAGGADARRKEGLVVMVGALAQALEEARVAWLRAEVSNFHPMSPPEAERSFGQLAAEARAALGVDASGIADPNEHAAEGAAVVTLIVAAHRELIDVQAHDANDLAIALRGVRTVQPHELVAADMVWSPAAEGARMSMRELAVRHPQLVAIAEHSIGGRVFCSACRAPYPSGTPRCPGCGTVEAGAGGAAGFGR